MKIAFLLLLPMCLFAQEKEEIDNLYSIKELSADFKQFIHYINRISKEDITLSLDEDLMDKNSLFRSLNASNFIVSGSNIHKKYYPLVNAGEVHGIENNKTIYYFNNFDNRPLQYSSDFLNRYNDK